MMKITFDRDLPPLSVEVLTPDLRTVETLSLKGGQERRIAVPSEASFLRVHLPSGKTVAISHPGQLDYHISRQALEAGSIDAKANMIAEEYFESPAAELQFRPVKAGHLFLLTDSVGIICSHPMEAKPNRTGVRVTVRRGKEAMNKETAESLRVLTSAGFLHLQLPGNLCEAHFEVANREIEIQVGTSSGLGDSIGAYLLRANYEAANSMSVYWEDAFYMLAAKQEDPFAAAVGAYLLLRLERFDLLHDWPRNLAHWFPRISDGAIIWGYQQLARKETQLEATEYLLRASTADLPVFTEGLRLLRDGLIQLGSEGEKSLRDISQRTGQVLWNSPFTACFFPSSNTAAIKPIFRINYRELR